MDRPLFDALVQRVENLLCAYQEVCAENRRLQEQVQGMLEQKQTVRSRVDNLLEKLEGIELP